MKTPPKLGQQKREGVALLVVLVFIMLLSVIVIEYAYEAEVEATLGAKRNSSFKAYITAKSAVATGLDVLQADLMEENSTTANRTKSQTSQSTTGKTTQGASSGQTDNLTENWAIGIPIQELDKSAMQCTIADECGKLNLNAIFRQRGNTLQQQQQSTSQKTKDEKQTTPQVETSDTQIDSFLEATLRALFESFGLQEDPTDAILDWLDQDSEPNPLGAESDFYQLYDPPYACRNGKMASIEELMLIKGITPELFFDCLAGTDNQQIESKNDNMNKSAANNTVTLSDLLTVHGDPLGRININTAHPKLIEAMLKASGNTNPSTVEALVQARNDQPFLSIEDLQSRGILSLPQTPQSKTSDGKTSSSGDTGITQGSLLKHLDVKSSVFRIWGDGCNADTMVRIETFVFRVTDEFLAATGQTPQQAQAGMQLQKTTTKTGNSTVGYPTESFRILDWRVIR